MQQPRPSQLELLPRIVDLERVPTTAPYRRPEKVRVFKKVVWSYEDLSGSDNPTPASPGLLRDFLGLAGARTRLPQLVRGFVVQHGVMRFPWARPRFERGEYYRQSIFEYHELASVMLTAVKVRLLGIKVRDPASEELLEGLSVSPAGMKRLAAFLRKHSGGRAATVARLSIRPDTGLAAPMPSVRVGQQEWALARLAWPAELYNIMVARHRPQDGAGVGELRVVSGDTLKEVLPGSPWAALCGAFRLVLERPTKEVTCHFCGGLITRVRAARTGARYYTCHKDACRRERSKLAMRESRTSSGQSSGDIRREEGEP